MRCMKQLVRKPLLVAKVTVAALHPPQRSINERLNRVCYNPFPSRDTRRRLIVCREDGKLGRVPIHSATLENEIRLTVAP